MLEYLSNVQHIWTEPLGLEGGASSSQLQLSGTHCHFTFAPVRQSQSVSSRAQDSSFHAGLLLTFPLRTIEETELYWTSVVSCSVECRVYIAVFWVVSRLVSRWFSDVHQRSTGWPWRQWCVHTAGTVALWECHDGRSSQPRPAVSSRLHHHSTTAEARPERLTDDVCRRHTWSVRHCTSLCYTYWL